MPQSFMSRRSKPPGSSLINPNLIARHRPELALAMLDVITSWASVEAQTARTITSIVEGDVRPILVDLFAAQNSKRQREKLLELAEKRLPPEDYMWLQAILELLGRYQRGRNRLAHYESGICPEMEDAILLANPRDTWLSAADDRQRWVDFDNRETKWLSPDEDLKFMREYWSKENLTTRVRKILVYKMPDFICLKNEVRTILDSFQYFNMMVSQNPAIRARGLSLLQSVHAIQLEMESLRGRRNTPEEAPLKPNP